VRSHPELRIIGSPTFCFSFASDDFDIYHVNDFMRGRGCASTGSSTPNGIHMAVTPAQTQPGVVEATRRPRRSSAVRGRAQREKPASGAILRRHRRRMTDEADDSSGGQTDMLDKHQSLPR